jgi:hydrogenase expression/formation protein HypC
MCVTYPGQVVSVADGMAVVDIDHQRRRASLVLVPQAAVGDWVIVAAGTVLEVMHPEEAAAVRAILDDAQGSEEVHDHE